MNFFSVDPENPAPSEPTSDGDAAPVDSSKQTESATGESGPILSPTSLKNPRIRKFSMGVDQNEEEVIDENAEDEYFVKYKN